MRRILSLDGGGIRGVFTLEILLRIQKMLRDEYDSPGLVLADHFDFFAGTSTGAIIATCLCWGMAVEDVLGMYVQHAKIMFRPVPMYKVQKKLFSRFEDKSLSELLLNTFSEVSEDGKSQRPALLGSARLKKLLLVVVRNSTTGSHWPLTNNPKAKFADPARADSNLRIPLWKVVRASTAAPVYFEPEVIQLGDHTFVFEDGSVTPYNNPATIAALTATLPCYRLDWTPGPDNIRVISIGTIRFSSGLPKKLKKVWLGRNISRIPTALIEGIAWEQDFLCRCLGECIFGGELDGEIEDMLIGNRPAVPSWFSYVRYNQSYKIEQVEELLKAYPKLSQIDAVHSIPHLQAIGRSYAKNNVKLEHLI
jgi:hypothetical protein